MTYYCGYRKCFGHGSPNEICEVKNRFKTKEEGVKKMTDRALFALASDGLINEERAKEFAPDLYKKFLFVLENTERKSLKRNKIREVISPKLEIIVKEYGILSNDSKEVLDSVVLVLVELLMRVYMDFERL